MLPLLPALTLGTALHLLAASGPPITRFSGHLDHAPAGDTVSVWLGPHPYKAALSASGDFALTIKDLKAPVLGSLSYARQRTMCYLTPGDQLSLKLDFADFDKTLVYSGRGAVANNYLAQSLYKFEYGPAGAVPRPQDQRQPTTTPAEARQYADAFRQQQRSFLASYARAHPLPAAFQQQQALDVDLQWGRFLLDYPAYIRYKTKAEAVLPADYFSFLSQLPLHQLDSQAEREPVLRFLSSYGNRLDVATPLSADPASAHRLYAQATADLGPGRARDFAIFELLSAQLIMGDAGAVVTAYPTFRTQNRDSTLAHSLRAILQKQAPLLPGKPAPVFSLRNASDQPVSLADFKGKVVYLDFWASWCVPCLAETPAAVELKKQFEGREVVFLYVSVDRSAADWEKSLASHPLTGANSVHLRDQDGPASTQAAYQANGIPSYWLIGRDGHIVLAHAPRPSDGPKTVAAIEAALKN
ncbi:redoxin domain-containing protein [Hymenobacter sp. UV11]|uniref:TlpA family protein disulfide reductase n=1 Tax=Hymenobacter sp. UV11 TaxID=1849735 RepID=UPI0010609E6C|nr:TlpA disulfide reductase family protein [Hymenobacter sp. UV11]TDN38117.1 hypothetical protein A8B98_25280 [Hymenobacter sp. UV11]TFZ63144.1 redoxin domain-containing protein [Hymenobacter sp. UV11]